MTSVCFRRKLKMKQEKILKEDFDRLQEFIQRVSDIITPISYRDELKAIMNPETRKNLSEKYPKCWMPVNIGNKDIPFLPLCNRNGATDKNMIAFAMKLCKRLNNVENVDRGTLEITMRKLERLHSKYSKEPVKPSDMAARKANVTKSLQLLKRNLDYIRGNQD
jgi:hypothetical protein